MASIAYITDSKMLELHRLNKHKTMNFWRLSNKINFSDFKPGDLVFFLSKDKEHQNKKEKGIVGFGRLVDINLASVKSMWNKYGILNGYKNIEEFKEAIIKVSKDKKLPQKISSFFLENVVFFQPVYLSECGMNISSNVESYIYLKPEEVVSNLLYLAKQSNDLWSNYDDNLDAIEKEEMLYALYRTQNKVKDIKINDKEYKKSNRVMKKYATENNYRFINNSNNQLYKVIDKDNLEIVVYHDKDVDIKLIIGQIYLFKKYMNEYYKSINISFKTNDNQKEILEIL